MRKPSRRWAALLPLILVAGIGGSAAGAEPTADFLLSQGKPVFASSAESAEFDADKAVDGSTTTRWASAEGADPQWLLVDLGEQAEVHRVKLNWEAAYGKDYRIEVSNDATTFTTVKTLTNQNGAIDDITGLTGQGRYLRVVGTKRGTAFGYSLFELEAYGVTDSTGDTQAPTVPTGLASTGVTSSAAGLSWTASTDNVGVRDYDILRNGAVVAAATSTSYTDTGLAGDTSYSYSVRARDLAGNVSGASAAIAVKTTAGGGGSGDFVLAAAGDIAKQCTASSSSCIHPKTAKVVDFIKPANILTMGDNQYDNAEVSDYNNYYAKTWGKFKSITKPSVGNHESYASPPFSGYDGYFGAIAKPQGKRYYSWNKGNWHFVALDTNDFTTEDKGPAEQMAWLKADLAANTKGCVAVYGHHPRWSTGERGSIGDASLWKVMTDNKVDLVLNGHDHHYERFFPLNSNGEKDPNGTVEIIGGMAGASPYNLGPAKSITAKRLSTYGVLKLNMTDTSFTSTLLGLNNEVLDSSPTYTCKAKP